MLGHGWRESGLNRADQARSASQRSYTSRAAAAVADDLIFVVVDAE
jgi:hypothetical protein